MTVIEQAKQFALSDYETFDRYVEGFEEQDWQSYTAGLNFIQVKARMIRETELRAEYSADIVGQ